MRPIKLICRSPAFKTGSFAKSSAPCRRKDARNRRFIFLCKENAEKFLEKVLGVSLLPQHVAKRLAVFWRKRWQCRLKQGWPEKFPDGAAGQCLRRRSLRFAPPAATRPKSCPGRRGASTSSAAGIRPGAGSSSGAFRRRRRPKLLAPHQAEFSRPSRH